jgi:arylsulfatase A-like enzyme
VLLVLGIAIGTGLLTFLLLDSGTGVELSPPPEGDLPDIVVMMLDTVRYDRLLTTDGWPIQSTALTRRIAHGLAFNQAYSTSCWTIPAHASLISGLYPYQHRADQEDPEIAVNFPVLAELLTRKGYYTAAITENGMISRFSGFDRGFVDFRQNFNIKGGRTNRLVGKILSSRKASKRPLFMFVNLIDAHRPYHPEEKRFKSDHIGMTYKEALKFQDDYSMEKWYLNQLEKNEQSLKVLRYLYDLEVRSALEKAEAILRRIEKKRQRTQIVILVSDHGETFGELGFIDHRFSLQEPLVHVPLVVIGKGFTPGVSKRPTSLVDLFPTILNLAQVEVPQNQGVDLRDEPPPGRELFMSYAYPKQALRAFAVWGRDPLDPYLTPILATRKEHFKWVQTRFGQALHDLRNSNPEAVDVSKTRPDLAADLLETAQRFELTRREKDQLNESKKMDKATQENLRSLGYIQ